PDDAGQGTAGQYRPDRGGGDPRGGLRGHFLLLPAVPRGLRRQPVAVPADLPRGAGAAAQPSATRAALSWASADPRTATLVAKEIRKYGERPNAAPCTTATRARSSR